MTARQKPVVDDIPRSLHAMLRAIKAGTDGDELQTTLRLDCADRELRLSEVYPAFSVLYNLWHNAVNYSGDDQPNVSVSLSEGEACSLRLVIENSGMILSQDYQRFLLGRGLAPQKVMSGRTNKGLKLVEASLRALGWRVQDVCVPIDGGHGTRIVLEIPAQ